MNIKYKLLVDKYGWYYQEPNTDICTMISALNALKYYDKKINKKDINSIIKSVYGDQLGIGQQDFFNLLSVLNLQYDLGFFDLHYIKHMLDNDVPIILDTAILKIQNVTLTHMIFVSDYKIKNKKIYLFCSNMSHKIGSKWVPWNKIKKYSMNVNNKKFCKNMCLAIIGVTN